MRTAARLLSLLALLATLAPLGAQTLTQAWNTVAPEKCVWHAGDDPGWAAPNFDNSGWQPYSAWKIDARTPRLWVRCHASLASLRSLSHPALQVHLRAASQVFVNDALLGSSGNVANGWYSMGDFYTVPVAPASLTPAATIALAPGDTLTFLSDGVVEAQNETGQLFGFERARNISVQSAEEIASAAQRHGQQDDITVLTLAFAGAEVTAR
jgi:hypothetical protein